MTVTSKATHVALKDLEYEDGILLWGGHRVPEIAEKLGQTPFYAYARQRINDRVHEIRAAFPDELKLHYAIKANPMPEVVEHIIGLVDGLDVASAGELSLALSTAVARKDVSFAGPGKKDSELEVAIESGITLSMESEGEMRRIANLAEAIGKRPDVAIRINPEFELKTSGMIMGGRASPFGVDAERVPAMLTELRSLDLNFRGFHIYAGSQNLQSQALDESLNKTAGLVIELADSADLEVSFVNLGGGLGIPYFPTDQRLDLAAVGDSVERAVRKLQGACGNLQIIMELGRYLVGEAGIYVCRVVDVKTSRGMRYAVTDGGLHHHLAASGNFGQVIRKNYPVVAVEQSESQEVVTIVGPLCTPLDILGDSIPLDRLQSGSLIAILQSGAYGRTSSPEMFLSHPACKEVLL